MNIYRVSKLLSLFTGLLLLTSKQAAPRQHALSAQPVRVTALHLTADDLKNMGVESADELGVYEIIAPVQFKAGEILGLAGDVNKTTLELIAPAGEQPAPEKTAVTIESDPAIFEAIAKLEPGNTSHWTTQGKPELAALSALVGRKVTGKERDAAFAAYRPAVSDVTPPVAPAVIADDLRAVLIAIDPDDDENFDNETGTPKLELVSSFCKREVSAAELSAALDVLESEQTSDAE